MFIYSEPNKQQKVKVKKYFESLGIQSLIEVDIFQL